MSIGLAGWVNELGPLNEMLFTLGNVVFEADDTLLFNELGLVPIAEVFGLFVVHDKWCGGPALLPKIP